MLLDILRTSKRCFASRARAGTTNLKNNLGSAETITVIPNTWPMNDQNMPIEMENPFQKENKKCILCQHQITPDYKNIRLLYQFMSRFTGKAYDRHITGLCQKQHIKLQCEIGKAVSVGFMSRYYKLAKYAKDPKICDPDNPFRPHRF